MSSGARLLARPLSALTDPMSGFFGLPASVFRRGAGRVNPIGFKIALELYVKCGIGAHAEVPIRFGVRTHGESKLTGKVIVHYLRHLLDLYMYKYPVAVVAIVVLVLFVAVAAAQRLL